jgi:hypothetical protein
MTYVAFGVYLLLIIFAGIGVYMLWTAMVKPAVIDWLLLPGTIVSEMAYILGCLVTGGEIRRAKLIGSGGGGGRKGGAGGAEGKPAGGGGGATTETGGGIKYVGPLVASILAIVACGAGIFFANHWLGGPVIEEFREQTGLSQSLFTTWEGFWGFLREQIHLLQRGCEALYGLDWRDWHVPLFVYLAACLSIRLAPTRRDMRWTLAAAIFLSALTALLAYASPKFKDVIASVWPLVTYIWTTLLLMLLATLLLKGLINLGMSLAGKGHKAKAN